jgi:phage terminase small subunit
VKIESLPPKQRRFVEEYLKDLNGTQAAIRAGYSEKTANEQAAKLLAKGSIKAVVQALMAERSKRTEVTTDRVVEELAVAAFLDPAEIVGYRITRPACIACLPEQVRRAIVGWGWDKLGNFVLKFANKTTSQDLLGRHLGMFTNKLELSGNLGLRGEMSDLEMANRMLTLIGKLEARAAGKGDGHDDGATK